VNFRTDEELQSLYGTRVNLDGNKFDNIHVFYNEASLTNNLYNAFFALEPEYRVYS
jgi:hypothetical protein